MDSQHIARCAPPDPVDVSDARRWRWSLGSPRVKDDGQGDERMRKEDSPLDLLADQIREAEARREAVEEKLKQTASWRLRRRTLLERRLQRRRRQEQELKALVRSVSETLEGPGT